MCSLPLRSRWTCVIPHHDTTALNSNSGLACPTSYLSLLLQITFKGFHINTCLKMKEALLLLHSSIPFISTFPYFQSKAASVCFSALRILSAVYFQSYRHLVQQINRQLSPHAWWLLHLKLNLELHRLWDLSLLIPFNKINIGVSHVWTSLASNTLSSVSMIDKQGHT